MIAPGSIRASNCVRSTSGTAEFRAITSTSVASMRSRFASTAAMTSAMSPVRSPNRLPPTYATPPQSAPLSFPETKTRTGVRFFDSLMNRMISSVFNSGCCSAAGCSTRSGIR